MLALRLFLICVGGAVGTAARYLTALWAARAFGAALPIGTLFVNLIGSFLIAVIMHVSSATDLIAPDLRLMLTTGVMGGFTTYSTFNYETTNAFREGAWMIGFANIAATLLGCLIAGVAGLAVGRWMVGR